MKPMKWVIEANDLTRVFGNQCVVDRLSMRVPQGGVYAFLGRNGSGKTTTIRMLLGLLVPSGGTSSIFGEPSLHLSAATRAKVGYLTEEHRAWPDFTVRENGLFQSRLAARWNDHVFRSVIGHFGLKERARAGDLSRGERAGLALALTLAPEPELVVMDDPALGLDPVARRALVEAMVHLTRRSDRTIFYSTHELSDVERVADWVAVLDQSVLRAACSLEYFRDRVVRYAAQFTGPMPSCTEVPGLLQTSRSADSLTVTAVDSEETLSGRLERLGAVRIDRIPLSLEEALVIYLSNRGDRSSLLIDPSE